MRRPCRRARGPGGVPGGHGFQARSNAAFGLRVSFSGGRHAAKDAVCPRESEPLVARPVEGMEVDTQLAGDQVFVSDGIPQRTRSTVRRGRRTPVDGAFQFRPHGDSRPEILRRLRRAVSIENAVSAPKSTTSERAPCHSAEHTTLAPRMSNIPTVPATQTNRRRSVSAPTPMVIASVTGVGCHLAMIDAAEAVVRMPRFPAYSYVLLWYIHVLYPYILTGWSTWPRRSQRCP